MLSYVYEITNQIDGRIYVGKANDCKSRWQSHVSVVENPLYVAMFKHGVANFDFKVVEEHESPSKAYAAESARIRSYHNSGTPIYNSISNASYAKSSPAKSPVSIADRNATRCDTSAPITKPFRIYYSESKRAFLAKYKRGGQWKNKAIPVNIDTKHEAEAWFEDWLRTA